MRAFTCKLLLALTVLSLLLCTGCAKAQEPESTDEENLLKLSCIKDASMELSTEETEYLDALQTLAAGCRIRWNGQRGTLEVENTTGRNLKAVSFYILPSDEDGTIKDYLQYYFEDLGQGEKASVLTYVDYELSRVGWDKTVVIAQSRFEESFFYTEPVTLAGPAEQEGSSVSVRLAGDIPYAFKETTSWGEPGTYTVEKFEYVPNSDGGSIRMFIKKQSGEKNEGDSAYYRIVDADGVIWQDGSIYANVAVGETFFKKIYVDVPAGEYFFQFFD